MTLEVNPSLCHNGKRALIFLHIPKAAGTTLHRVLERQYPARATFSIQGDRVNESIERFRRLPENKRAAIRCLKGHMPFGLHRDLPAPSVYITILRNPLDRAVSYYYYALRTPGHYLYHELRDKKMTLEAFANSGLTSELENGQTRLLSGDPSLDSIFGHAPLPSDTSARVRDNLRNHFAAIGLSERFDESLLLFGKLFGWRNLHYVKENVSADRISKHDIPGSVLETIEKANAIDVELYREATKVFDEMLQEHGIDGSRVARFRAENRRPFIRFQSRASGLVTRIGKKFRSL